MNYPWVSQSWRGIPAKRMKSRSSQHERLGNSITGLCVVAGTALFVCAGIICQHFQFLSSVFSDKICYNATVKGK